MSTYRIVRMYQRDDEESQIMRQHLTIDEAQEWCHNPETSSSTATSAAARRRTEERGPWFDGYEEERAR